MKKIILIILIVILLITGMFIYVYPKLEFYKDSYLYMMTYSKDYTMSEDFYILEEDMCYNEVYSYNKKRNISIIDWEYKSFLFFRWFKINYKEGNICDSEYLLEEEYIQKFLKEAKIDKESDEVDLAKLIEGKRAIVSNKRYSWNDDYKWIGYELDGKYQDMFIYTNEEGLLIIQVGSSDEGAKYIAYK